MGVQVARQSKRKSMIETTEFLAAMAGFLVLIGGISTSSGGVSGGIVFILFSFIPIGIILGLTFPTRCNVIGSSTHRPCTNYAYGFLFGCTARLHKWPKFFARLHLNTDALRQVESIQPTQNRAAMYQPPLDVPDRVPKVGDSSLSKCAAWATIVGLPVTIIGIIISIH